MASRRTAQEWIRTGRVRVGGRLAVKPDTWVSWPGDSVTLDEQPLLRPRARFILFHKPKGVMTTRRDDKGRSTIFDVLPPEFHGLQAIGRLDQATSGLLLCTNDTKLANLLTNPVNRIPRIYLVTVRGEITDDALHRAITGVIDRNERLCCNSVTIQKRSGRESHLNVTLTEGKNREIRRLFLALGHEVTRLRRVQFGPFALGELLPGAWRELPLTDVRHALGLSKEEVET